MRRPHSSLNICPDVPNWNVRCHPLILKHQFSCQSSSSYVLECGPPSWAWHSSTPACSTFLLDYRGRTVCSFYVLEIFSAKPWFWTYFLSSRMTGFTTFCTSVLHRNEAASQEWGCVQTMQGGCLTTIWLPQNDENASLSWLNTRRLPQNNITTSQQSSYLIIEDSSHCWH